MGCCASTARDLRPYTNEPASSQRAINAPQPGSSHSNTPIATGGDLKTHINVPLKRHTWTCRDREWSRDELDRERTEFFDTRVDGNPEIWQAIKAALEVLWNSAPPENDGEVDAELETAQQILNASDITIPHKRTKYAGTMVGPVYDLRGHSYVLPEHIVADPSNMIPSQEMEDEDGSDKSQEVSDTESVLRRREEKGKSVAAPTITIRIKLSDREAGGLLKVEIFDNDCVKVIARKISVEAGLPPSRRIKLAYLGQILKDKETLSAQGWKDDYVVNAFVFDNSDE